MTLHARAKVLLLHVLGHRIFVELTCSYKFGMCVCILRTSYIVSIIISTPVIKSYCYFEDNILNPKYLL